MYDDSWYSFVPDTQSKNDGQSQKSGHRRRESMLKQPHEDSNGRPMQRDALGSLYEENSSTNGPPKATIARRAKSHSDFYHVARAQLTKEAKKLKKEEKEAETFLQSYKGSLVFETQYDLYEDTLLYASQEEFQMYRDQLALSERHLDGLLEDTTSALDLLAVLSASFQSVDVQTTAFQAQCEDLLTEQQRLKALGEEVGLGLQYYSYLEPITRRLNAPGASRVIGDDSFVEMLTNLDACIAYMTEHHEQREAETYLARYKSLLARALNLIRIKFTTILQEKTAELTKRIPEGKITMTTIFLLQSPQNSAIGTELEGLMQRLEELIYPAFDDTLEYQKRFIDHEGVYSDTFNGLIVEYINSRNTFIPETVRKVVTQHTSDASDSIEDISQLVRSCYTNTLEICSAENSKFLLMFLGRKKLQDYFERGALNTFYDSQVTFKAYLGELCSITTGVLEPYLSRLDITSLVDLVSWLVSNYNDKSHMGLLMGDDASISDQEEELDANHESETTIRARLASRFKDNINGIISSRMTEVVLKDIEKFDPKHDDLKPKASFVVPEQDVVEGSVGDSALVSVNDRVQKALGPGLSNAYPPVKTAITLLTIHRDLNYDSRETNATDEMAYNILHQTSQAVLRAADQVKIKFSSIDGRIFAIKNLVLMNNFILAYEISGSRKAASIDFSQMWNTFNDLRSRGQLFDVRVYYTLLSQGKLLPQVVENIEDACVELDGILRQTIVQFREEAAGMLWNQSSQSPTKDSWKVKKGLQDKLEIMFSQEEALRTNLWAAVEENIESRKSPTKF